MTVDDESTLLENLIQARLKSVFEGNSNEKMLQQCTSTTLQVSVLRFTASPNSTVGLPESGISKETLKNEIFIGRSELYWKMSCLLILSY